MGGEPFLGREPLRVMEMMAELQAPATVAVTTNATQWSSRIARICAGLDIALVMSLDGITPSTYESIRAGADFEVVMANLERFADVVGHDPGRLSIAHCLMPENHAEFIDLLEFAEQRPIGNVGVNTVVFPRRHSLYQLPLDELRVVATLELQDSERGAALDRFRPVWDAQLRALRHHLIAVEAGSGPG